MIATLPCAIYTRKSSEEGLEQGFNSLDAQREACNAYVLIQESLGWRLLTTHYDNGGFSGGNMERPALQRLMSDIRARRIRIVVVYKVDRLTRSLADFSKLIELFDSLEVSFVSVTQQFNTTTSMGRLTLNVLLSFAQFERGVTGERIRDKIAASKCKGMWMGGIPPLGYVPQDRTLVIDETQAQLVRAIFELYLSIGSIPDLKIEVDRRCWVTPTRSTRKQNVVGGRPFSRGHLRNILQNPVYRGRIIHKGVEHDGLHKAIIDEPLWLSVQEKLGARLADHHSRKDAAYPSLLLGLMYDSEGKRFEGSQAIKHSRRYRYYVCPAPGKGAPDGHSPLRIPAVAIESAVIAALSEYLNGPAGKGEHADAPDTDTRAGLSIHAETLVRRLREGKDCERIEILKAMLVRLTVYSDHLELSIRGTDITIEAALRVPFDLQFFQKAVRLVVSASDQSKSSKTEPTIGALMVKANDWLARLRSGRYDGVQAIASEEGISSSYVTRVIYLSFLAPDLALKILSGDRPHGLSGRKLLGMVPLPERWDDQRRILGMAA